MTYEVLVAQAIVRQRNAQPVAERRRLVRGLPARPNAGTPGPALRLVLSRVARPWRRLRAPLAPEARQTWSATTPLQPARTAGLDHRELRDTVPDVVGVAPSRS